MPRWTEEEHKKYLKGVKKFGNSWVKVAEVIGTRDRLQCYEHSRSKSVVPYIRKKSSKSPSLRKRTSSTKSSSKKKKKSASNKRSTSVKRTKKSKKSNNNMSSSSTSSDEEDEEGRSSTTGLLSGEIELGLTSPRQRANRKRTKKKKSIPSFELDRNSDDENEEPDLTGDYWNVALLLLLYTLQGIPMGLTAAVSLVLSENKMSLAQQGMFALVSWPFSLKLLWAPIVDSVFVTKFGRRKTWLIPTQLIIAATIMYAAPQIELWMKPDALDGVFYLTVVFFLLFLMCATQDICVDGWALTLLQKKNVGYASTCNAIGQTLGNSLSYIGWIALDHYKLCSFGTFMWAWAVLFASTTVGVMLFKKEEEPSMDEMPPTYINAYKEMWQVLQIPLVQQLIVILMTCKFAFAPEMLSQVMLVGTVGIPKTDWAFLGLLLTIPSLLVPKFIEKYTAGPKPFNVFMKSYVPRIILGVCSAFLYLYAPTSFDTEIAQENALLGIPPRVWNNVGWYLCVVCVAFALCVASNAMFVAQMALFAKVSDPRIGGTYMTLLNTMANLGYKWTSQLFLYLTDKTDQYLEGPDICSTMTEEKCNTGCGWDNLTCTGTTWKENVGKHNGFYYMMALFSAFGIVWMYMVSDKVEEMQKKPLKDWHVKSDRSTDEKSLRASTNAVNSY